jgi:hypothetical protein
MIKDEYVGGYGLAQDSMPGRLQIQWWNIIFFIPMEISKISTWIEITPYPIVVE